MTLAISKSISHKMKIAVTGDFSGCPFQILRDNIYQSGKSRQVSFKAAPGEGTAALIKATAR
jgi:hypothetical protein